MKSDRRTLIIAAVLACFLIFSSSFQSLFLFGARLVPGQVTVRATSIVSTSDPDSPLNLGAWTLKGTPSQSGSSRDERLGLVLVKMLHGWHDQSGSEPLPTKGLEDYCNANPDDLKARAHLTRMAININSLKGIKHKEALFDQAGRLSKMATDCAKREPDNWFWRDRQFHFLMLIEDQATAISVFTARPFPQTFEDYVQDEVSCKETVYKSNFYNLPASAMLSLWAETLYPHFNSIQQFNDIVKTSDDSMNVRIAEMECGRAMVNSCPSIIAALVGLRNIRHGLWKKSAHSSQWKPSANDLKEEEKVKVAYQAAVSKVDWEKCLRLAKDEVTPRFLHPDEEITSLYVGQLGPTSIAAGILSCFYGALIFGLARFKLKSFTSKKFAWPSILLTLTLIGSSWKDWGHYYLFSLGSMYLTWLLIILSIYALICSIKGEKGSRLLSAGTVIAAILLACAFQGWQATSTLFMIMFAMQRGKTPLNPWAFAIGIFFLAYHTAFNLAVSNAFIESHLWLLFGIVALFVCSKRPLEPDEARLAPVTIGVPIIILGIFLLAQYDKGIVTTLDTSIKEADMARARLAKV